MSDVKFFTASDFHYEVGNCDEAARIANRLLQERGTRVYGGRTGDQSCWSSYTTSEDTHSAILVAVEPIVRDTPESLLREILRDWEDNRIEPSLRERARRVLEGGAK